jgi:hypothetical protein
MLLVPPQCFLWLAARNADGSLCVCVACTQAGRPGEAAIEVARLVERGLRESRAVDLEALVVLAGATDSLSQDPYMACPAAWLPDCLPLASSLYYNHTHMAHTHSHSMDT